MFGLEFVVLGQLEYDALIPALVASVVGDLTMRAWGTVHAHYPTVSHTDLTPILIVKWVAVAIAVAMATTCFIELTHWFKHQSEKRLRRLPYRMFVGGLAVVGLWQLVGTSDYLGLGVPTILRSFSDPSIPIYAFALKLIFTAVTLGAGFLGGEVTPLFFVGAALGSVLGRALGIPIDLAAGVGMAAVFAAASNTPLALSIMAVELLGGQLFLPGATCGAVERWCALDEDDPASGACTRRRAKACGGSGTGATPCQIRIRIALTRQSASAW